MIEHISETSGLSGEDAYVLASLCVDLKISEIVDAGQRQFSCVAATFVPPLYAALVRAGLLIPRSQVRDLPGPSKKSSIRHCFDSLAFCDDAHRSFRS
jgi:hypothetical protein